jgi:DNA-binding MurR/RpiR family transcriptional regulator
VNLNKSDGEIIVKVKFLQPSLTKSEKKAADFVLERTNSVADLTLEEFCALSGCSQASTIRFCQKLGIGGFSELKQQLSRKDDDTAPPYTPNEEIGSTDSLLDIMEKVFTVNIQILKNTLTLATSESEKALTALLEAESVTFFGMGDAAVPCYFADIKFKKIGLRSQVHTDPDLQLAMASLLGPGDVAVAVSHSGRSQPVVEAMRIAKERGAVTLCITKHAKSPLVKYCDIQLFTATADETIGKEIIARRVAEQAILESLYLGLLARKEDVFLKNLKHTASAIAFNKIP